MKVVDSRDGVAKQALRIYKKQKVQNNEKANNSEKTLESIQFEDKTFFVTSEKSSKVEYELLSKELKLPYGGLLA